MEREFHQFLTCAVLGVFIRAILESLGLPTEVPQPDAPQPPPGGAGRLAAAVS